MFHYNQQYEEHDAGYNHSSNEDMDATEASASSPPSASASASSSSSSLLSSPSLPSSSSQLQHIDSDLNMNMTSISHHKGKKPLVGYTRPKNMALMIDMMEYPEDRNDDSHQAVNEMEHLQQRTQHYVPSTVSAPVAATKRRQPSQKQLQYPQNHYGYDLQQKQIQQQQQQQQQKQQKEQNREPRRQKTQDRPTNTTATNSSCPEPAIILLDGSNEALTSSPRPVSLRRRSHTMPSSTVEQASHSNSNSNSNGASNSAVGTPVEQTTFSSIPSSPLPPSLSPILAPQLEGDQRRGKRARSRSVSISSSSHSQYSTGVTSSSAVPLPTLPLYPQQQQGASQQGQSSPARGVIVNIQPDGLGGDGSGSGSDKTDGECEAVKAASSSNTAPTTLSPAPGLNSQVSDSDNSGSSAGGSQPQSHTPQHSPWFFDFFKNRKASLPKHAPMNHQQAVVQAASSIIAAGAAAAAAATAAGILKSPSLVDVTGQQHKNTTESIQTNAPLIEISPPMTKSRMNGDGSSATSRAHDALAGLKVQPIPPIRKSSSNVKSMQRINNNHSGSRPSTPSPAYQTLTQALETSLSWSAIAVGTTTEHNHLVNSTLTSTLTPVVKTQSTFSRVAAALVGATVGRHRPSLADEVESGTHGSSVAVAKQLSTDDIKVDDVMSLGSEKLEAAEAARDQGLDQEQLDQHTPHMRAEKTTPELMEFIDRLYQTILSKDVALERSKKQVSNLQKELEHVRSRADDDKKALIDEVDCAKKQIVIMEENFLLWRTKVHNDQLILQEDILQEHLVKQDHIEKLEEDLNTSQAEVHRLRSRLLILEYEDGYIGPSSLLPEGESSLQDADNENDISFYDSIAAGPGSDNPSTVVTIEYGPMTVATHKRRSNDFKALQIKAQSFEQQVQELKKLLETEKQDRQRELIDFRMKMNDKCVKLQQEMQAAKMESTMYTEMMHEVVAENDGLRKQIKDAQRMLRKNGHQRGYDGEHSGNYKAKSKSRDLFGYSTGLDDIDDSGSEDELEDVII
ncbi:hypothetical protein EDD11_007700 [Mortierella claussenii]|nr:hypothetical protein EDD11_007700 [Mortierella claussenii]